MLKNKLLPIQTSKQAVEFANKQLQIFWLPDEIKVEKDIQDVLVNMTEAEKHGVITTLKLFSIYETHAGSEYWGGRFRKIFDSADMERMASVFSMFELAIHAPFYNKINQLLHIDTPEFYLSYLDDPAMKQRVQHIGEIIDHEDDAVSLGSFSMVEGVILYSSFGFLKHFQAQGKNVMNNVVRGIDFGTRDENLHSIGSAWAFKELTKDYTQDRIQSVKEQVKLVADKLLEHELLLIDKIFEKGRIEGVTAHQLECFVKSRINACMQQLGFEKIHEVKYDPISDWFYKSINDYQYNDFFSGAGREYNRNWDSTGFVWKGKQ